MRIVSLVPSWTEYLVDLGLKHQIVGRTKFCIRPHEKVRAIEVIGGTKNIHIEKIERLKPDLIIANIEENDKQQVEACQRFAEILLTDVRSVESALRECERIAEAVGRAEKGKYWIQKIRQAWGRALPKHAKGFYVVWKHPLMVAGGDTYIHDVMRWWGITNSGDQWHSGRYPQPSPEEWELGETHWVLLPSEPFPFQKKHLADFEKKNRKPLLVDGEAFSWYGSRMLESATYLAELVERMQKEVEEN
ncbi:MAG TPA: cobalamin-binding protein [Opitutae bacterium]|nr:cobalamin-binding protein [Opitutae bacterium]